MRLLHREIDNNYTITQHTRVFSRQKFLDAILYRLIFYELKIHFFSKNTQKIKNLKSLSLKSEKIIAEIDILNNFFLDPFFFSLSPKIFARNFFLRK